MGISSEADFLLNQIEPDSVFAWEVCIMVQLGVRSQQQRSGASTEYSGVPPISVVRRVLLLYMSNEFCTRSQLGAEISRCVWNVPSTLPSISV